MNTSSSVAHHNGIVAKALHIALDDGWEPVQELHVLFRSKLWEGLKA